jgi:hypothetical protein
MSVLLIVALGSLGGSQAAAAIPVALIVFVLFLKALGQTQGHSQPLEPQAVMYRHLRRLFGKRRNFGPGA